MPGPRGMLWIDASIFGHVGIDVVGLSRDSWANRSSAADAHNRPFGCSTPPACRR